MFRKISTLVVGALVCGVLATPAHAAESLVGGSAGGGVKAYLERKYGASGVKLARKALANLRARYK